MHTSVQLSYKISQNFLRFVTYHHTEICVCVCMYVCILRGRHIAYVQRKETLTKSA